MKRKDKELEECLKRLEAIGKELLLREERERFFICEDCLKKLKATERKKWGKPLSSSLANSYLKIKGGVSKWKAHFSCQPLTAIQ